MNILVLNGSPKKEHSDTMHLTRAFLEGMGEQAEIINAYEKNVKPCLGCFGCWQKDGCVQKDDMTGEIFDKIMAADLVIWSMPLYFFAMPAQLKLIMDRLLPVTTRTQATAEDGHTYHPTKHDVSGKTVLIAGSGFPDLSNNFEALAFQFRRSFGEDTPMILTPESPLLNIAQADPVTKPYLELVRQAGREYAKDGHFSKATQQALAVPMLDPDEYRGNCGQE